VAEFKKRAADLFEQVRRAEEMFEPMGYPVHELCDLVRDQQALIERPTKPMTLEEAVAVLNEIKFNGMGDWKIESAGDDEPWVVSDWANIELPSWAAVAVAMAAEAREEAVNG
jgi:hypothetical protein